MLLQLAIFGYRSLKDIVFPFGRLNLITGVNGSGKSNVYRALRLLGDTAQGNLITSLAKEGGLKSTLWAGPEKLSGAMISGEVPIQGGPRKRPIALKLGFSCDQYCYTLELGLPAPSQSLFALDPIIKRECLWRGPTMSARNLVVDRRGMTLRCRGGTSKSWEEVFAPLDPWTSMLSDFVDPEKSPETVLLRDAIRSWRFYDQFATDRDAPARRLEVGTYTPVLASDGSDLAAALQTIRETGKGDALDSALQDAFPGSSLVISPVRGRLEVALRQTGLLRELGVAELSDGTLRYLLLIAALLTSRPPELMVLNEPETSLHPDLLPALARRILEYASSNQIVVVTHSSTLIGAIGEDPECCCFELEKQFGATQISDVDPFTLPGWKWPSR